MRLDFATSTVESGTIYDGSTKYIALLEFSFSVQEYLKGSGSDDIVAVWNAGPLFDTEEEAEEALPAIVASRDAQWDDREAIVFLKHSATYLTSTQQAGRFFLSGEILSGGLPDDYYSLASPHNRLWLPAEAAVDETSQATGDQQRFLTAVPPATGAGPHYNLGRDQNAHRCRHGEARRRGRLRGVQRNAYSAPIGAREMTGIASRRGVADISTESPTRSLDSGLEPPPA